MSKLTSKRITWPLIGGLLGLATTAAWGDDWPISFAKLAVPSAAYGGVERKAPHDCQPESFDPKITRYRLAASGVPAAAASAPAADARPAAYAVEGADESVMTINSRNRPDDAKTALPEPYAVTTYLFACGGQVSQAFEFDKNGKRYALYTHVYQAAFSPDLKKLVLFNYAKPYIGPWQELRRIINISKRSFAALPVMNETAFLADVGNDRVVTYGLPVRASGRQKSPHRIAAVWGPDGQLVRALSLSVQAADRPADAIGLLPNEPSTFYHLSRTGENACTLRLQDIQHAEGRRAIALAVPGAATEAAGLGARVQIDFGALRLKDGAVKYRVSASGKGDVANDWGPWQTAQ